jgi:hypothetical protein
MQFRGGMDIWHAGAATADDVLTQWYELVVLRRTRSGRLVLEGCQLFPPSAQRGDLQRLTIRCEPSDGNGTVFAVVTCEPPRSFRLLSIESASLAPGSYELTAELMRPGLIQFHGLPSELRADHRSWQELVASIPARIDMYQPAHLICAVEVSGTADQVQERIFRIEQLIRHVEAEERQLAISLVSYGPHSFDRRVAEEPTRTLTWASASDEALAALDQLSDRGAVEAGYARAAQLECALTKVAARITGRHGRPALVTVGSRPPFPPRMDPSSEILPCPERNSWRRALQQIGTNPGITFGAIHDHGPDDDETWRRLGSDAVAHLKAVNIRRFAATLKLLSLTTQPVPFPILEKAGS